MSAPVLTTWSLSNPAAAGLKKKRVLLIDDVFTTGATLRAATAALKSAGVAKVSALTLARVDGRAPAAMNLDTDFSSTGLAPLGRALAENDARRKVSAGSGA